MIINLIFEFGASLLECLLAFWFIDDIKRKWLLKICISSLMAFSIVTLNFYHIFIYGTLVFFLAIMLFYIILFKRPNIKETILSLMIYIMTVLICDGLMSSFIGFITKNELFFTDIIRIAADSRKGYLIINKIFFIPVIILVKKKVIPYDLTEKTKLISFIAIGACVLAYFTLLTANIYILGGWILYICLMVAIAYAVHFFDKWKEQEYMHHVIQVSNQVYAKVMSELKFQQDQRHQLLHDMKYHLLYVYQLVLNENYKECCNKLEEMTQLLNYHEWISYSHNTGIDFMLNYKIKEAEKNNIKITLDVDVIGEQLKICQEDIHVLFGNLFDNAIEAVSFLESTKRNIRLKINKRNNILLIHMQNPYMHQIYKKNGVFITNKEEKTLHGWGIKSVKAIVKKYNGTIDHKQIDGNFIVDILIFEL